MKLLSGQQQGDLQERFADHNRAVYCLSTIMHSSTSMHSMLCYRRWKCIRRSSTTVTTSSEPSLSCGSNAGMLQRNHRRLHCNIELCIHSMQCIPLSRPIHPAAGARHFTRHHCCNGRAFLFHSQTAKDIPSVVNGIRAADIIGADPRTCANDANRTCRSR